MEYQLPGRGTEAEKFGPQTDEPCKAYAVLAKRLSECQEQLRKTEAVATAQQREIQELRRRLGE